MTDAPARDVSGLLPPKARRKPRIGLVAGGLGAYWPQFPELLPQLQESARYVSERFEAWTPTSSTPASSRTPRRPRSPPRSCGRPTATSS